MADLTPLRLTLLGAGAHESGIAPSGLLIEANGQQVVLGAKGALTSEVDAHLTTDPSEGGSVGVYAGQGLTVEPRMVQVGNQSGWGYKVTAAGRTISWAPRFSSWPAWADNSDVMFAEGAGWDSPYTSASGTVHAGAIEVSRAAAEHGVKRLVVAHQGRATLAARAAGHSLPFGTLGVAGQSFTLRRDTLAASPLRVRDLVMTKDGGRRRLPAPWAIRKALEAGALLKRGGLNVAQKCKYGPEQATKAIVWAEGSAYVPVCDAHLAKGQAALAEQGVLGEVDDIVALPLAKASDFELEEPPGPEQDVAYGLWKATGALRYTLGPLYIPNHMDNHGEWTTPEENAAGLWRWVRKGNRDIHRQHSARIAGEAVEQVCWPYEVTAEMILPSGLHKAEKRRVKFPPGTNYLGVVWSEMDWADILAGRLRGLSYGGLARRITARFDEADLEATA